MARPHPIYLAIWIDLEYPFPHHFPRQWSISPARQLARLVRHGQHGTGKTTMGNDFSMAGRNFIQSYAHIDPLAMYYRRDFFSFHHQLMSLTSFTCADPGKILSPRLLHFSSLTVTDPVILSRDEVQCLSWGAIDTCKQFQNLKSYSSQAIHQIQIRIA